MRVEIAFADSDDSNSSDRNGRKSLSILRGTGGDFQHSRQTRPSAGDHNEGSDSQLPFLLANNIEFDLDLRAITTFSPAKSLANFMRRLGEATQRHVWTAPAGQDVFGVSAPVGCSHVSGLFARHS